VLQNAYSRVQCRVSSLSRATAFDSDYGEQRFEVAREFEEAGVGAGAGGFSDQTFSLTPMSTLARHLTELPIEILEQMLFHLPGQDGSGTGSFIQLCAVVDVV